MLSIKHIIDTNVNNFNANMVDSLVAPKFGQSLFTEYRHRT